MSIELNNVSSGYSTGVINDNFQRLEDYINQYLLNRDGTDTGEPNQMELDLDMNGHAVLNVGEITSGTGRPFLTEEEGDLRYVNVTGDVMAGSLDMATYPLFVRIPVQANEPARKDQLDVEISQRQSADANLQGQISGGDPLEASAFSEISWHDQEVSNSVIIPNNKNAWSFGPTVTIAPGQVVTVGTGSFWTIANGVSAP